MVVRVCKIINEGDSAAIRTEPLVYLQTAPSEWISRNKCRRGNGGISKDKMNKIEHTLRQKFCNLQQVLWSTADQILFWRISIPKLMGQIISHFP